MKKMIQIMAINLSSPSPLKCRLMAIMGILWSPFFPEMGAYYYLIISTPSRKIPIYIGQQG
jgi:hypothetical protein